MKICHLISEQKLQGSNIIGATRRESRIKRALLTDNEVREKAIATDPKTYHFHAPELIPVGLYLLLKRKKVIFDIHKNFVAQINTKTPIARPCEAFYPNVSIPPISLLQNINKMKDI